MALSIEKELRSLLESGAGRDRFVSEAQLRAAGIPRKFANGIRRASKRVMTEDDAADLAAHWADEIEADLNARRAVSTDPRQLADEIPRGGGGGGSASNTSRRSSGGAFMGDGTERA